MGETKSHEPQNGEGVQEREPQADIDISLPIDELLITFPDRHTDIARRLIDAGEGSSVVIDLDKFQGLDHREIARRIIDVGKPLCVITFMNNFDKFQGLDHKDIVRQLIDTGQGYHVARYYFNFQGLDHRDIARQLIDAGYGSNVAYHIENFQELESDDDPQELDHADIARWIIDAGKGDSVVENLDKFKGLDHADIARWIIDAGKGDSVAENLDKFKGLDHADIAKRIIDAGEGDSVARHLTNFKNLNREVAIRLIDAKQGNAVARYFDKFQGLEESLIAQLGSREVFDKYKQQIFEIFRHNRCLILSGEDIAIMESRSLDLLHLLEVQDLKTANAGSLDGVSCETEEDACKVFEVVERESADRSDPEISKRFRAGAEVFGYRKMFRYAVPGKRHDALYAFDNVLELRSRFDVDPNAFYGNILQQVAMDNGTYGEDGKTSYQMLNDVVAGFNYDIEGVLASARQIEGIPQLQILLDDIKDPKDIVSSWKMLLQYKELCVYVDRREMLEELGQEPNEKLRSYVATLLFHPSVSDTRAVELFWRQPEVFLGLDSSHTSAEVHDRKKPTNYLDIPNLDLTAVELRDALVDGALDRVQVWRPMEVLYEIPSDPADALEYKEFEGKTIEQVFCDYLGPQAEVNGIQKKNELFGSIRSILEEKLVGITPQTRKLAGQIIKAYVLGESLPDIARDFQPDKETQDRIRHEIYYGQYGLQKKKPIIYKVKINLKSDPDGVVAGNDTQCCMPFGDGKNTLYTYNPVCALMTVQREVRQGSKRVWRTVAQSVLTKDKDIGTSITDLRSQFEQGNGALADMLPQDILLRSRSIIACDSVEVANNSRTSEYSLLIANLYRDFLGQYARRYGEEQGLDISKAVTGSCSYRLEGTGTRPNTFLPQSPVAYSDKYQTDVHTLNLETEPEPFYLARRISVESVQHEESPALQTPNVEYLTFQDALETAYIEGRAYHGSTLKEGIAAMENALIAKDINNATKRRNNMALKYVSETGEMQAYLLAYEGVYGRTMGDDEQEPGERCIYVMDLAKLPSAEKGVGGKLIEQFIVLYGKNYIEKGDLIPIKAEAREVSSYKLIQRNLNAWGKTIGIRFELEEGESFKRGNDTMHPVTIRPVKA